MYQPTGQGSWNRPQLYPSQPDGVPQQYTLHPRSHVPTMQYNQRPGMYGYQTDSVASTAMKPAEMQARGATERPQSQWDNTQGVSSQYVYDQRKMYPEYQKKYSQSEYAVRYPSMNNMNTTVMSDPAQRLVQRSALPGMNFFNVYKY